LGLFQLKIIVDERFSPSTLVRMVMKRLSDMDSDLVLAAVHGAPIVEATSEEMAAFDEGLVEIRAGRAVSAAQIPLQDSQRIELDRRLDELDAEEGEPTGYSWDQVVVMTRKK
jgi:hypothetical protein